MEEEGREEELYQEVDAPVAKIVSPVKSSMVLFFATLHAGKICV
jgi:hypothetical protein